MIKKITIFALVIAVSIAVIAQTTTNKTSTSTSKKFVYAELYYQDKWDVYGNPQDMFVRSDYINDVVKDKVKSSKYTDDALNTLGAEGWELIAVMNQEVASGTEYTYFLKKPL